MSEKLYVSISGRQIHTEPKPFPWEFAIEATPETERVMRRLFRQIEDVEWTNFTRAHLPIIPYHLDKENHMIDRRVMKLYALVHEYGDEETKRFIEELPYFR
ncbi:transposase [Bhargavaea ullalensis]|uniref:Transposase n=1 Tax=Bhargavaea ullalensis TaxID=1265685 RepID=A0ABV2GAK7_9BACL